MTLSSFKALSLLSLSFISFQIASPCVAQTASGFLNWPGKSGPNPAPSKAEPPAKTVVAQPSALPTHQTDTPKTPLPPQPSPSSTQSNPIIGTSESYVYSPMAVNAPAKSAPVKKAEPLHKETWPKSAQIVDQRPKIVPEQTVSSAPAPKQKPSERVSTDAYQVPSNSKYAARLAQIRQQPGQTVIMSPISDKTKVIPSAKAPPAPLVEKTSTHKPSPPTQPTSSAEVNPAHQTPRVYSLHRQYGLTPDTISVSPTQNGALLVSDLNLDVPSADD